MGQESQVIQKISDEELLIRIFKVRWAYIRKKEYACERNL